MSDSAAITTKPNLVPDAGPTSPWPKVVGILLLSLGLTGIYGWRQFDGLTDPDTMELAAVARNVAQGKGFVTSCVRPVDLWFLAAHAPNSGVTTHVPEIRHGPVYASILALLYLATGLRTGLPIAEFTHRAELFLIVPLGVTLTALSGLFVFLSARLLATEAVGLLALTLFGLSLPVLQLGLWGGPTTVVMFLGIAAFYCAVRSAHFRDGEHGDETAAWFAPLLLSAFLCGLAVLTRYAVMGLPALVLIFLFHGPDRKRCFTSCLIFCVLLLSTLTPWLIRNILLTGSAFGIAPYLALNDSPMFAGHGFDASLHPVLRNLAVTSVMKAKFVSNVIALVQGNLPGLGAGVVLVLFAAALFVAFDTDILDTFRRAVMGGVLVMFIAVALLGAESFGLMAALLPCMIILATAGFYAVIQNIDFHEPERETLAMLALVLWTAGPTALALFGPREHTAYPPYYPPFIAHVSGFLERDDVLCTDIPWATAWYGGQTSILLPSSEDAMKELWHTMPEIAGLYLTTETARAIYTHPEFLDARLSWRPLLIGRVPPDFPFPEAMAFPEATRDQWFYTDAEHMRAHAQ